MLTKYFISYCYYHQDQINIESKIKVVRFIGELVKFSVFPRSDALLCLRSLLNDFNHHHIEMACNLLETCGRFLYRLVIFESGEYVWISLDGYNCDGELRIQYFYHGLERWSECEGDHLTSCTCLLFLHFFFTFIPTP